MIKKYEVKNDFVPKTNQEYISVTYRCIRLIDSYRFLSSSLDSAVKTLVDDDFEFLAKEFPDKWEYPHKKLAYPYEQFKNLEDYQKSANRSRKKDFFSKLKMYYPDDKEIEGTREIIKFLIFKIW